MGQPASAGAGSLKRRTPPSPSLVASQDPADRGAVGKVAEEELTQALQEVNFPPLIAWDRSGTVRLANEAAAEMLGIPLDELVGTSLTDLAAPARDVEHTMADLAEGRFVGVHTHRLVHVRGGEDRAVLATSRAVEVDGRWGGVTAFVSEAETGRLGRDPLKTWLDLVPVAVGLTDQNWIVETVSTEIAELIDRTSSEVRGTSLLGLVDPEQVDELRGARPDVDEPRSLPQVRFVLPDGGEVAVCVLLAPRPEAGTGMRFALVGRIESYFPQQQDRVADLELRLRRIGAEVRAAGLIDTAASSTFQDHPEIGDLSSRQWEILSRLLDGERVPTIAKELFISQSTVRNHLSMIFRRFGVHSQAELLEKLREPRRG